VLSDDLDKEEFWIVRISAGLKSLAFLMDRCCQTAKSNPRRPPCKETSGDSGKMGVRQRYTFEEWKKGKI
jgi:hypothetical protein